MFALRQLLKTPGFTLVALLTLALGVGVNATVYSVARDLYLTPMLRDRAARLVSIFTRLESSPSTYRGFSSEEFAVLRADRGVFTDVAAFRFSEAIIGVPGNLRARLVALASENYFSVLATAPAQGRFFTSGESRPGAEPVLVASHALWQRFGGRADFLGSQVLINQRSYTVIGITPVGFGGLHAALGPDLWLPLGALDAPASAPANSPRFHLVGNLRPGLTVEDAAPLLPALAATLNAPPLGDPSRPSQLIVTPPPHFSLGTHIPQDETFIGHFAVLSFCLSLAVLFVACLNLANMLLARGAARRKEIALRFALGATRWQVMRPLLAEGLVLGLSGGGLGLVLSFWPGDLLLRVNVELSATGAFAFTQHAMIDYSLVIVAFALGALATLAFSLLPAFRATRVDLVEDLKLQSGAPAETGRWNRFFSFRHCLVMGQIAISLLILFSAAIFLRSAHGAAHRDQGFNPAGQVIARLDFRFLNLSPVEQTRRQLELRDRIAALPGVAHASFASNIPFNFEGANRRIQLPSTPSDPDILSGRFAYLTAITPGYFRQLGITLLRGRDFTAAEAASQDTPPVAIIDESLARHLFADIDPVGRHVFDASRNLRLQVIGVVRGPQEDFFQTAPPQRIYRPLAQEYHSGLYLHLTAADPAALAALVDTVRRELRSIDPAIPVLRLQPLADVLGKNLNLWTLRLAAYIFIAFGGIALFLALLGIYAVKSYAVSRRTREIGIRLALGAQRLDVVSLVLRQGALQAAVAVAIGVVLSLLAGRVFARLLLHVSPFEPVILLATAVIVAVTAILATWIPARRAASIDLIKALRSE